MLSGLLHQPRGVSTKVSTYMIKHRDFVSHSFAISTVEDEDGVIKGGVDVRYNEISMLYSAARIISVILDTYKI